MRGTTTWMMTVISALLIACVNNVGSGDLNPPCEVDADCIDSDPCTIDECAADMHCRNTMVAEQDADTDGDGYTCLEGDCDDTDVDSYPGAPETCDGRDNNCDGQADEGFDVDQDQVLSCEGDCDDTDAEMFPGNTEVCDGKDNDCDGYCDNCTDCLCCVGEEEQQPCGDCGVMIRRCTSQCSWGEFGACQQGCTPGEIETGITSCGNCGHEERTCNPDCTWSEWTCVGEGVCNPGQIDSGGACGNCGHEERICGQDCAWGGYSCVDQGVCSPNATQSCGSCSIETCNSNCGWNSCVYQCSGSEVCFSNSCVAPPNSCSLHQYNNHLYAYCSVTRTWQEAKDACSNWGGYLVVVNGPNENSTVYGFAGSSYYWIALQQSATGTEPGGGWSTTISNHSSSYRNWCSGEPNDDGRVDTSSCSCTDARCAAVGDGYYVGCNEKWVDECCSCEMWYVCEMDP